MAPSNMKPLMISKKMYSIVIINEGEGEEKVNIYITAAGIVSDEHADYVIHTPLPQGSRLMLGPSAQTSQFAHNIIPDASKAVR